MSETPDNEGAVDDQEIDEPTEGRPVSADDVAAAVDRICNGSKGKAWRQEEEIDFGSSQWRPHAVSNDKSKLLYVFLQDELPRYVQKRLRLAVNNSITPTIALGLRALFQSNIVELLTAIEADVIVLDDYAVERQLEPRPLLAAMADIEVPVPPELRRTVAQATWSRMGQGSAHQKGRRLEALLSFAFAQIQDLKVVEHNYRTETEEIDLVLQVDNFSSRVWQKPGVPFILVEAKNRADKADQPTVSTLITKLQTKRGSARIAILVSLAGFTDDARMQELRFSTSDLCIVMIDQEQLERLLLAEDIDGALETVVRKALLR